ncbi:MAG: AAA family ATPase [Rhodobacterales bacterium]|nr:AAA family ATPase [Rhodobacterales bacterium]
MTQVEICCGVGGTGKTTTAAALGVGHALAGHRVVVLTIDPARRLADALGTQTLGNTPSRVPLADAPGELWALMLDRKDTWDKIVRRFSSDADRAEKLLENRYYKAVSTRLTGSHEYMAIEKLHELVSSEQWDVVVVDTPPTRHVVDFFEAPERVRRVFDHSVISKLIRTSNGLFGFASKSAMGVFHRLAGEREIEDIYELFNLISDLSHGFRSRHSEVRDLLRANTTTYWLVANADAPQRNNIIGFLSALRERDMYFGGFLLNRCEADPGRVSQLGPVPAPALNSEQTDTWSEALERLLRRQHTRALRHQAAGQGLSASAGDAPVWMLPELSGQLRATAGLSDLARCLPPLAAASISPVSD